MPTYQYACTVCGHQLEAVQSFSDPALTECPNCQGKLRKLYSAVGIVFKGSGFYRTDSRSGSGSSSSPAATPAKESSTTTPAKEGTGSAKKESGSDGGGTKSTSTSASTGSTSPGV